jgi:hypothetical protein
MESADIRVTFAEELERDDDSSSGKGKIKG